jgi:hypothetical protein
MQSKLILNSKVKRQFNVNSEVDYKAYKKFLVNGGWGKEGCPFVAEWPWVSVPDMIKTKIVAKTLNVVYNDARKNSKFL